MTNENPSVAIIGGGISGLSTAYELMQRGINVTVYEKSAEVGGAIRSVQKRDWLVEEGPNTLMVKTQALWDLLTELGLSNEIIEANNSSKKRFVIKNGVPEPLPMSLGSFLTTPLLSGQAKLRLFKEPFAKPSPDKDESIATFVKRRLGQEPLDYAVNPFVSGIYAGDPKSLSIKHTFSTLWQMEQNNGSLLAGLIKDKKSNSSTKRALISFKKGNQQLPRALSKALPGSIHTSTEVQSLTYTNHQWILKGSYDNEFFEHAYDSVLSTVPPYVLKDFFEDTHIAELADLSYVPMATLALGYEEKQLSHPMDGFGMLSPEVENQHFLGSLFSSTLFDKRAPKNHHLLTCFIGGARQPELASTPPEELKAAILPELSELLGIEGDPIFTHHKYWPKAIPQYEVGYDYYLSLMEKIEKKHRGLFLQGNFRNSISVPDCIESGFKTAQRIETFLKTTG